MSDRGDIADRAAVREAEFLQDALARQARRFMPATAAAFDCDECGAYIPAARRNAVPGVRLCVDCQTDVERKERGHAV